MDFFDATPVQSVGGWFGDIMEGIKQPTIDALGFKIRNEFGVIEDQAMRDALANRSTETQTIIQQESDNTNLMLMGMLALGAILILDD